MTLALLVHFSPEAVLGIGAGHRIQLFPAERESLVQLRQLCPTGTLPGSASDAVGSLTVRFGPGFCLKILD